jgi:hypothetical protein
MAQTFACPECGAVVAPARVGPGRRVRCGHCATLLEVPYFPRTRQRGRRSLRWRAWAYAGAAGAVLVLAIVGIGQGWRALERSRREEAARQHQLITRAEAGARLAAIEATEASDPASAVQRYDALLEPVSANPALGDMTERIQSERDRARETAARADLAAARGALEASNAKSAVALCERVIQDVAALPPGRGGDLRAGALSIAATVASSRGVILEPVSGKFRLGSTSAYNADLRPVLASALEKRGYVPLAEGSPLRHVWNENALYRMSLNLTESQNEEYQQSRNRISEIDGRLAFTSGGAELWHAQLTARTQVPLPNIAVYEATRLALAPERNPAVELRFYRDARKSFHDKVAQRLRELPEHGSRPPSAVSPEK